METRNISISIARELYNSSNKELQEDELDFRDITTFEKVCEVLGLDYDIMLDIGKSSTAMFKLSLVRKVLNLGYDLSLTKSHHLYYPKNYLVTENAAYGNWIRLEGTEVIGKIKSEEVIYNVLGGAVSDCYDAGLCSFHPSESIGYATTGLGFLGCATKEIAQHFGKYFGMLITEAKYADIIQDFMIIESKY